MSSQSLLPSPSPVFVFGCQRSGTSLLEEVLARSPTFTMFREDDPRAMTPDHRILPPATIAGLIQSVSPQRALFKPLCDSHFADRLLDQHPDARAIWLYRDYAEVASSLQRVWPDSQKGAIRELRFRRFGNAGWLGERVSEEVLQYLELLWTEERSNFESACLMWCVRNHLYFELGLDRLPERVLLLRYQDMVEAAEEVMPEVFRFVGASYAPDYIDRIATWNLAKDPRPPIHPHIATVCDTVLARLDRARQPLRAVPLPTRTTGR